MATARRTSRALIVSLAITALSIVALVFAYSPFTPLVVQTALVFVVLPSVAVAGMIAIIAFRMDAHPRRLAITAMVTASVIFTAFFVGAIVELVAFGSNLT
jgi:hypothetical protein